MHKIIVQLTIILLALTSSVVPLVAQEMGAMAPRISTLAAPAAANFNNPMVFQNRTAVCGGMVQAGTPIAGNAAGAGNSGQIPISGIPLTAVVMRATLYWTVLTNSDQTSNVGASIIFNGSGITGTKIGTSNRTPCFPQTNTIAWKADVTALMTSPGNGSYPVSGFPGGNQLTGANFTEGVTLQVLWADKNASLSEAVVYETPAGTGGLAVTASDTLTQLLDNFQTNALGTVTGTVLPIIGNGQSAPELYSIVGPGGTINLDNTINGNTAAIPADACSYTDNPSKACYWDDAAPNVSAALNNGATGVTIEYTSTSDCHDFPAATVVVSTDPARVCSLGGVYVDVQCSPAASYRNHGEYVSCVARAAETYLAGVPSGGTCPRADIQSCIVNPRARSSVGKK